VKSVGNVKESQIFLVFGERLLISFGLQGIVTSATMKYGEYIKKNLALEWAQHYLDYDLLKSTIYNLADEAKHTSVHNEMERTTSLSVPLPTNAAGVPVEPTTQENFHFLIDKEMKKVRLPKTKQTNPKLNPNP
jgi:hypothetical protein